MVVLQTCLHAPTYMPESLKLFAYTWFQVPPEEFDEKIPYWAAVASASLIDPFGPKKVEVAVR